MSKDIWHTADEKPNDGAGMVVYYSKEYDEELLVGYYNTEYEDFRPLDEYYCEEKTVKKWCYLNDLLALETENKDLSDKIGKLKSKLDIAVDALKDNLSQANFREMLDASRFHCIRTKCEFALEQITALEQKEVK